MYIPFILLLIGTNWLQVSCRESNQLLVDLNDVENDARYRRSGSYQYNLGADNDAIYQSSIANRGFISGAPNDASYQFRRRANDRFNLLVETDPSYRFRRSTHDQNKAGVESDAYQAQRNADVRLDAEANNDYAYQSRRNAYDQHNTGVESDASYQASRSGNDLDNVAGESESVYQSRSADDRYNTAVNSVATSLYRRNPYDQYDYRLGNALSYAPRLNTNYGYSAEVDDESRRGLKNLNKRIQNGVTYQFGRNNGFDLEVADAASFGNRRSPNDASRCGRTPCGSYGDQNNIMPKNIRYLTGAYGDDGVTFRRVPNNPINLASYVDYRNRLNVLNNPQNFGVSK